MDHQQGKRNNKVTADPFEKLSKTYARGKIEIQMKGITYSELPVAVLNSDEVMAMDSDGGSGNSSDDDSG